MISSQSLPIAADDSIPKNSVAAAFHAAMLPSPSTASAGSDVESTSRFTSLSFTSLPRSPSGK